MASKLELQRKATILTPPGNLENGRPKLIVVKDFHSVQQRSTPSEERRRSDAREALISNGILAVLEEVVSSMSPDRKAVLDFGFEQFGETPVGVIRWAPEVSADTGGVISKAVKVVNNSGSSCPDVYFADFNFKKGKRGFDWTKFSPANQNLENSSLLNIIKLAMSNATVKIEDDRIFAKGEYTGNPGIGKMK